MQTVIKKNSDQGTLVSGSTLTSVGGNEEGQLYDLLQNVLEKGDDAGTYIYKWNKYFIFTSVNITFLLLFRGLCGHGRMVVKFITTYSNRAYHH